MTYFVLLNSNATTLMKFLRIQLGCCIKNFVIHCCHCNVSFYVIIESFNSVYKLILYGTELLFFNLWQWMLAFRIVFPCLHRHYSHLFILSTISESYKLGWFDQYARLWVVFTVRTLKSCTLGANFSSSFLDNMRWVNFKFDYPVHLVFESNLALLEDLNQY